MGAKKGTQASMTTNTQTLQNGVLGGYTIVYIALFTQEQFKVVKICKVYFVKSDIQRPKLRQTG